MHSSSTEKHPHLFGYTDITDQYENDADISDLYSTASKDKASKLVVIGGLHGYRDTGEPTGQNPSETGLDLGDKKICSFAWDDQMNKSVGTGINFIYKNIAKYTTRGSDVTDEKQLEVGKLIKGYLDGGYYVLLSWCFSRVWAESMGL